MKLEGKLKNELTRLHIEIPEKPVQSFLISTYESAGNNEYLKNMLRSHLLPDTVSAIENYVHGNETSTDVSSTSSASEFSSSQGSFIQHEKSINLDEIISRVTLDGKIIVGETPQVNFVTDDFKAQIKNVLLKTRQLRNIDNFLKPPDPSYNDSNTRFDGTTLKKDLATAFNVMSDIENPIYTSGGTTRSERPIEYSAELLKKLYSQITSSKADENIKPQELLIGIFNEKSYSQIKDIPKARCLVSSNFLTSLSDVFLDGLNNEQKLKIKELAQACREEKTLSWRNPLIYFSKLQEKQVKLDALINKLSADATPKI